MINMKSKDKSSWGEIDWEKVKPLFDPEIKTTAQKLKESLEKYPQAKEMLMLLAGVGGLSLGVLVPGIARMALTEMNKRKREIYLQRINRWKKRKWVAIKETVDGPIVEITQDGIKQALSYKLNQMKVKTPKKWDGKWRVIIFDVAEKNRKRRNQFRTSLQNLNFCKLNKSVWVHPYPCFEEIEFLRQISGIGNNVTYILAERLETSEQLHTRFNLNT